MVVLALLLAAGMQGDARTLERRVATTSRRLSPMVMLAKAEKPKIKLELTVTPRLLAWMPWMGPALVRTRVKVTDPQNDLYCPEVTWLWGDETKSVHQEDCDFFQPGEVANETWYSNKHLYKEYGKFVISVFLKAATMTRVESSTLEIR